MVIAVYEDCGMSEYARHTWDGIEISALPYFYSMPEKSAEMENGVINDVSDVTICPPNPEWPRNYIQSINQAYHRYDFVLIPMIRIVLDKLKHLRIPYVLMYPSEILSEEDSSWIKADTYGRHIVLEKGQKAEDHRIEIEQYVMETEIVLPLSIDQTLISALRQQYKDGGLCIEEQIRQGLIHLAETSLSETTSKQKTEQVDNKPHRDNSCI